MKLTVEEGHGFPHEIVLEKEDKVEVLATVYDDPDDGRVDGLELAYLFAAAPVLLQACKDVVGALHSRDNSIRNQVRAAIELAERQE